MKPTTKLLGAAASAAWLEARGLDASRTAHWYVEISIPSDQPDTRFEINIYPEEWGFVFRRGARLSSIRVTDVPFVHGLDNHRLLAETPVLERIRVLIERLEQDYGLTLDRGSAAVNTNLTGAAPAVRLWLES